MFFARNNFEKKILFKDKKDAKIFNNFKIWLKKKLSALSASLNFIKNQKDIDFLVIGIDNYFQLKQITEILKSKKKLIYLIFKICPYKQSTLDYGKNKKYLSYTK